MQGHILVFRFVNHTPPHRSNPFPHSLRDPLDCIYNPLSLPTRFKSKTVGTIAFMLTSV